MLIQRIADANSATGSMYASKGLQKLHATDKSCKTPSAASTLRAEAIVTLYQHSPVPLALGSSDCTEIRCGTTCCPANPPAPAPLPCLLAEMAAPQKFIFQRKSSRRVLGPIRPIFKGDTS